MQRILRSMAWLGALGLALGANTGSRAAGLDILETALTDGETSWNAPVAWQPGQQVFVRTILGGVGRDGSGRISVRESLELRDQDGGRILDAPDLLKVERSLPAELGSLELLNQFQVPEGLSAGTYKARISCEDDLAGTSVARELPFVVAEGPLTGLRITGFTLSAIAGGGSEILGSAAQAEARVAGYRLDAAGLYWIEADVVLVDPSGQLALRWDKVLEKREKSEPRGLPLKLSVQLELPEHYASGDYRLELKVRDRLAEQEAVQSATWTKR